MKDYIQRPVGESEIESFATLAIAEEADFFRRNPHLIKRYSDRLIGVALCQGAALPFLGRGYGVNDFDLHFFYRQNRDKPRLSRAIKRIQADAGSFENVAVDFVRTVVPWRLQEGQPHESADLIRAFLRQQPTDSAQHLAQKQSLASSAGNVHGCNLA